MKAGKIKNIEDKLRKWPVNNKGRRKILLAIFPHPDDETMASGGLLAKAKKLNWQTHVLVLTKGEAGQNLLKNTQGNLGQIREKELKKAAGVLKIDNLMIRDLADGGVRQQSQVAEKEIGKVIRQVKPDWVVTYDHSGLTGHPDHITVSLLVKKIVGQKPKSKRPQLFWVSMPLQMRQKFGFTQTLAQASQPDHVLFLGKERIKKWRALRAHRSQKLGNSRWSLLLFLLVRPREWYHEVNIGKNYSYQYVEYQI